MFTHPARPGLDYFILLESLKGPALAMIRTITLRCHHCLFVFTVNIRIEDDADLTRTITVRCPNHGGPLRIRLSNFKEVQDQSVEAFEVSPLGKLIYPSQRESGRRRWWQFWK